MRIRLPLFLVLVTLAPACGGGTSGGGTPRDADPDAGPIQGLDAEDCAAFADSLHAAAQACGQIVPVDPGAVEAACRKGVRSASLCGGDPTAGLACFATADGDDWMCGPGVATPYCQNDLDAVLGAYCLTALGTPECAGLRCEGDYDCPEDSLCNGVTGQCFWREAYCVGLPCDYGYECPEGQECNTAEHVCVLE
jgi:hypothetical protein